MVSCKICGKQFKRNSNNQIYCSKRCQKDYKNISRRNGLKHKQLDCVCCGKSFTTNVSNQIFCSKDCQRIETAKKRAVKTKSRSCRGCGKEYEYASYSQLFCNIKCRNEYNKEHKRNTNKKWTKDNKWYSGEYYREVTKNKPEAMLLKRIGQRIRSLIHRKKDRSEYLLGCNRNHFLRFIEDQFTSDINWQSEFDLDHIIPCGFFVKNGNVNDVEVQRIIFNYRNYRPLNKIENIKKGNKLDLKLVSKYGIKDLLLKFIRINRDNNRRVASYLR